MVVKEKRGRRRYVAFTVSPMFTKDSLISALRITCGEPPYVILCAEGWAVVRCAPTDRDASVTAVKLADPAAVPLCTSGTLATLYDRYPELKRLRPPIKRHA